MIYFYSSSFIAPQIEREGFVEDQLRTSFEVKKKKDFYLLHRTRLLDGLRIFRLFFPRVISKLEMKKGMLKVKYRLDGLGFFMLIMVFGAIIVEFTMDRIEYPRDYPIWTPFALFIWYLGLTVYEVIQVRKSIEGLFK